MEEARLQVKEYIDEVCIWLHQRGFSVEFDKRGEDAVYKSSKLVSIKSSRALEGQLHTLLHECGHILIEESDSLVNGKKEVLQKYNPRSKIHKTFTIIEEVEAWKRGLKLSRRLGILINKEKWNKDVAKSIMAYMKWATG